MDAGFPATAVRGPRTTVWVVYRRVQPALWQSIDQSDILTVVVRCLTVSLKLCLFHPELVVNMPSLLKPCKVRAARTPSRPSMRRMLRCSAMWQPQAPPCTLRADRPERAGPRPEALWLPCGVPPERPLLAGLRPRGAAGVATVVLRWRFLALRLLVVT